MFPILVSLHIWGAQLQNKKIVFHCDNLASVHIVNSMTSKNDRVMTIVRDITLLCLKLNIAIKAQHVNGCCNQIADALSRFNFQRFFQLAPEADKAPTPVPSHLLNILY